MKLLTNTLLLASAAILFFGCNAAKDQQPETGVNQNPTTETLPAANDFISGTVTEIQNGKDGYTAQILTQDGEAFFVTISRANLTDPNTYKTVKVGETVQVKGDQWQMENQNHITVRELK